MITPTPAAPAAPRSQSGRLWIDDFWDTMKGAYGSGSYGSSWTAKHGDHDKSGIWGRALAKFHNHQIKTAIAVCIKHYTQSPPTLGQFLEACRKTPAPDAPYQLAPPRRPSTAETQSQWLKDLKEMMFEAQNRPPMSQEERDRHLKILGLDDAAQAKKRDRRVAPGSAKACHYPGCCSPGELGHATTGGGSLYCAVHFTGVG